MAQKIEIKVSHLIGEEIKCHKVCSNEQEKLAELWAKDRRKEVQKELAKKYIRISGTYTKQSDSLYIDDSGEWSLIGNRGHYVIFFCVSIFRPNKVIMSYSHKLTLL